MPTTTSVMPGDRWTPISGPTTSKDGINRLTGKRRLASIIKLLQRERLNLGMHLSDCPELRVHFYVYHGREDDILDKMVIIKSRTMMRRKEQNLRLAG